MDARSEYLIDYKIIPSKKPTNVFFTPRRKNLSYLYRKKLSILFPTNLQHLLAGRSRGALFPVPPCTAPEHPENNNKSWLQGIPEPLILPRHLPTYAKTARTEGSKSQEPRYIKRDIIRIP